MSRRVGPQEPGFGSDSFLDIIANLVGILIILIVLAGLHASQTAVEVPQVAEPDAASNTTATISTADIEPHVQTRAPEQLPEKTLSETSQGDESQIVVAPPQPQPIIPPEEPKPKTPPIQLASDEQLAEVKLLQMQVSQLERTTAKFKSQVKSSDVIEAKKRRDAVREQLGLLQSALQRSQKQISRLERLRADESKSLSGLKRKLDRLNDELSAIAKNKPKRAVLAHRITPVGRVVDGAEIHFRLKDGKVSLVPIEDLLDEVKDKIQRDGVFFSSFESYRDQIGPVRGYEITYLVERIAVNRMGTSGTRGSMIRLSVTEFTIEPLRSVVEQPVNLALSRQGMIFRELQENPDATLTVWVYPESFSDYRKIASFAQSNGIRIAGRPLPDGIPIGGSPNGSQSLGQ